MKDMMQSLKKIYAEQRGLLWMMIGLCVLGVLLLVFSISVLRVNSSVVKIGYRDVGSYQGGEWSNVSNAGGYQDGSWMSMLAFPVLAIVFSLGHSLLAVKLFKQRGRGAAQAFLIFSMLLVLATFVVLIRLTGEG